MIHCHRVPLFAFQSFLCSFDALAYSCASHHSTVNAVPILGCLQRLLLSLFIKLDSAPKVWCCFIHYEGFSLLDSSENYPLIGCAHHTNTHQDCQSVMNLLPAETLLFKYMLSSTFLETIKSSRHASHSLP